MTVSGKMTNLPTIMCLQDVGYFEEAKSGPEVMLSGKMTNSPTIMCLQDVGYFEEAKAGPEVIPPEHQQPTPSQGESYPPTFQQRLSKGSDFYKHTQMSISAFQVGTPKQWPKLHDERGQRMGFGETWQGGAGKSFFGSRTLLVKTEAN